MTAAPSSSTSHFSSSLGAGFWVTRSFCEGAQHMGGRRETPADARRNRAVPFNLGSQSQTHSLAGSRSSHVGACPLSGTGYHAEDWNWPDKMITIT